VTHAPASGARADDAPLEYAGFWIRVLASLIDTVAIVCVTLPVLLAIYGRSYFEAATAGGAAGLADVLISWIAPAVAVIGFWVWRQATPGKSAVSARVVDARTGGPIGLRQACVRYLGYFVSMIPLGLGILWVAFDPRKQGWHDKLAGTVVVRPRRAALVRAAAPVRFDEA
jgi:uncharacterized RDD family membrane protein YckC